MPHFSKVLIANRGEIAVRIARTARSLGFRTVAVYSDADRDSPHVTACDEAVSIGGNAAAESYLCSERIVAAAERSGAEAVHPGYGFLSENAAFAAACASAGLTFVGPPVSVLRLMGNKAAAKARMREIGVPCIPGYQGAQDDAAFIAAANEIGFPLMIKAAAGGGGKGMRLVALPERLREALEATRAEAARAFGSGELLLEKALVAARHIEIQVFADAFGTTIQLGERDCSIQRRHQKIIEETPSAAVTAELRERLGNAAIAAARSVGYVGAGTVEFLLDESGAFYFLEMNTRLQVEHAVTEAVTGTDLVAWQLRVAAGEPLPAPDPSASRAQHAIEARLYAEEPEHDFLPQAGRIVAWSPPQGDGIRVDHALVPGLRISPFYDPLLAKIVAAGANREEARRRLLAALEGLTLCGPATNRQFLIACLSHPAFVAADARTDFVSKYFAAYGSDVPEPSAKSFALAAALLYVRSTRGLPSGVPWRSTRGFANILKLRLGVTVKTVAVATIDGTTYTVTADGNPREVSLLAWDGDSVHYDDGSGVQRTARLAWDGDTVYVQAGREAFAAVDVTFAARTQGAAGTHGSATSPMPGIVAKVAVAPGEAVTKGQTLVVLEAMKMMHEIVAGASGTVTNVLVATGQQVGMRTLLVEIDATPETAKEQAR